MFVSQTRVHKYVNHFCRIALRAEPNFLLFFFFFFLIVWKKKWAKNTIKKEFPHPHCSFSKKKKKKKKKA